MPERVMDIYTYGRESRASCEQEAASLRRGSPGLVEIRFFTFRNSTSEYRTLRWERGKWMERRKVRA